MIPKFIVQRTNPNTDRGAREELPVLLGVPCNGHEVILRELFSVAAAVDVQPLGVDDAVDVERLRAFASRLGSENGREVKNSPTPELY